MRPLLPVLLSAATLLAGEKASGPEVDLAKIDRKIEKEPAYTAADPLYGLAVFGPEAKSRVWMVLDKSRADVDVYDVLYADLNGDGDLTRPTERFTDEAARAEQSGFNLGDFTDPETGVQHKEFALRATRGEEPTFMISVLWRGEQKFAGGYAVNGDKGYMSFARSAADAPIVWLNGDGPFRFQPWYGDKLHIGQADDFKVFLGQQGIGRNSFAAFACHALPEGEPVLATLIYRDSAGAEHALDYELKERC
jgi:hypothetical protein